MEHILAVHGQQAFRHFVKRVPTKVLAVALSAFEHYVSHATLIHKFEHQVDGLVPVEQVHALDQLIA